MGRGGEGGSPGGTADSVAAMVVARNFPPSACAPAQRARSGVPAMSPPHRTIVDGVTQSSRAQPPLRPATPAPAGGTGAARRPSGGSPNTGTNTHEHTHAGRRAHTHAHEHVHTTGSPTSLGDGYGGRRAASTGARPGAGAQTRIEHPASREANTRVCVCVFDTRCVHVHTVLLCS